MQNNFNTLIESSTVTHDIPFTNNYNISSRFLSPVKQYSKFLFPESEFCDNRSSPVWIPESSFHEELQGIHNLPAHSISPQPTSSISISTHPVTLVTQICTIVCENPYSSAYMCSGCKKPIHAICGPSAEGMKDAVVQYGVSLVGWRVEMVMSRKGELLLKEDKKNKLKR